MTLEELCDCSADKLEALSDKQLIEILSPYFNVTRPELAPKLSTGIRKVEQPAMSFQMQQKIKQLAELGIDISGAITRKKK